MSTNVSNIIEPNGKTIKQNNLAKGHAIPIGTLVEVDIDYSTHHGIRMFVCEHTRDCDGSPLYALYHDKNQDVLQYWKENNYSLYKTKISDGYSEDCLTIVEPLKEAPKDYYEEEKLLNLP